MKNWLCIVAFPLSAGYAGAVISAAQLGQGAGTGGDVRHLEQDAVCTGGIRAVAAATGQYRVQVDADPENNAEQISQLVDWHPLIVIGRIGSSRSWLTGDCEYVVTDYRVAVETTLKGREAREITVSILGGRVSFEDGTTATVTSTMPAPVNGERYALFLRPMFYPVTPAQRQASVGPIYTLQHLALGVFQLDAGRVQPRARPDHPLRKAVDNMSEQEFIALINRILGR